MLSSEALNRSPGLPRFPKLKSSIYLPPKYLKTLDKFHFTHHPPTQHPTYGQDRDASQSSNPLTLYCPNEGEDYVVDGTVKELARMIKAGVTALGCVQLAADSVGCFGSGAPLFFGIYFLIG